MLNNGADVLNNGGSPASHIPKVRSPKCQAEFRPINICNVSFKIITKTIANRLKGLLLSIF